MAIEMVDVTQLENNLTLIANVIRAKNNTNAQLIFPNDFTTGIGNIFTGGGGNTNIYQDENGYIVLDENEPTDNTGHWARQNNWPNLDIIVTTNFDGIYLTYDLSKATSDESRYISVYAQGRDYKNSIIQRGHLNNNYEFVVDYSATTTSYKFQEQLDPSNGDIQLWRIINTETNGLEQFRFENINNVNDTRRYQPCVEMLYCYNVQTYNLHTVNVPYSVESIRIIGLLNNVVGYQAFSDAFSLKRFDASLASGTINDFRQGMGNCCSLTECNFGTIGGAPSWNDSFGNCQSLKSLVFPAFSFSGNAVSIITNCRVLEDLNLNNINVSNITRLGNNNLGDNFIHTLPTLKTLHMENLDFNAVTDYPVKFNLPSLINLYPPKLYVDQNWNCPNLSKESLLRIITTLPTISTTKILTIGTYNISKLAAAEIAIATGKGWTVA